LAPLLNLNTTDVTFLAIASVGANKLNFDSAIAQRKDYLKFCELLELEPGEYSDDQYPYFQQLVESLTRFNAESLAKMIDAEVEK
jgi:hypothetical protein